MTSDERRVIEALQAHTGGLIVTEQDMHHAQGKLQETLEITSPHPPRRPYVLAAAAIIALIAGVVGLVSVTGDDGASPPPTQDPYESFLNGDDPTAALLQGVWRVENNSLLLRFWAPNRVSFDAEGGLFHNPATTGTYRIDSDVITVSVDGGHNDCGALQLTFRASVVEPNMAHMVPTAPATGDDCLPPQGARWVLEQLLPTHPDVAGWGPPAKGDVDWPVAGWQAPDKPARLHAVWLALGGRYMLEIAPDGSYHVADDSGESIDSGEWSWRGDELTLTSGAESIECSPGDRLVQGVQQLDVTYEPLRGSRFMRATVQRDSCGRAWAGASWLNFSVPRG